MNTHDQIKELLTDYALRELPEQKSSEVKQHLADCQECRAELKKLEAVLECAAGMGELSADEQVFESAKQSLLEAVANEQVKEPTPRPTIRLDFIWSTIMKNKIAKLAAAAVIIIAILAGLPFIGGEKTLADVLEKINQTNAYMYTMEMKISGKLMPTAQESTIQAVVSDDYGIKWYVDMTDPNSGKTMSQQIYVLPEQKMVVTIMPETKQYIRMPFGDELLARMKQQNNDPKEIIKQIMKCEYTELDRTVIDGVEVQGFRTTDPAVIGSISGDATSVELTLWVDVEKWLPFRSEMNLDSGEQMQVTGAAYDYRWNVPVQASDFEPKIPDDYTTFPTDGIKMPGMNEADAIEGLRLFAEMTGRYPKKLNMMDVAQEIAALMKDVENLPHLIDKIDELKKLKDQMSRTTEMSEEVRNAVMKKAMEITRPLQSMGFFYMMLMQDKKDPVYYGDKVTPEFPHAVLMRWNAEDGKYRVIFADLTAEDVTADELAELEAAPLNIKPTAIRPQPPDGASVAFFDEVQLSWMPGAYVNEHKVYFGTAADQMSPLAEVIDSCSVIAPALEKAVTYYWRVDEVQPDGSIATSDFWSFNTGKLVGWWKLDGDAVDSSGGGNHGTIIGEPNLVMGKVENALQFDGIDDSVRTDYAADLPTWTVALWVNSPNAPSSAVPAGPIHREKNFQINWDHTSEDFRGAAALQVGNNWYAASFGELQANTWYHLAATYDGENLKAYKNGLLITDNPDPSGPPDKESATLKLARHSIYRDHFKGTIDDVCLYSYDLSADEVAKLYEDTLAASAEKAGKEDR